MCYFMSAVCKNKAEVNYNKPIIWLKFQPARKQKGQEIILTSFVITEIIIHLISLYIQTIRVFHHQVLQ